MRLTYLKNISAPSKTLAFTAAVVLNYCLSPQVDNIYEVCASKWPLEKTLVYTPKVVKMPLCTSYINTCNLVNKTKWKEKAILFNHESWSRNNYWICSVSYKNGSHLLRCIHCRMCISGNLKKMFFRFHMFLHMCVYVSYGQGYQSIHKCQQR